MAVTRDIQNLSRVTEWTEEINEIPNQYGWLKSQGVFNVRPTTQTAIVFDKNETDITLLPQVPRGTREATVGQDRSVETFSLPLGYFKHHDYITPEDVQGWRQPGTPDMAETLANVRATKLEDLRRPVDQTHEYMMIQAVKGVTTTPDGTTLADMFTEFGVTQPTIEMELDTSSTNVDAKISDIKRQVQANLRSGGTVNGIDVMCSESFFDKLIDHPKVRESYLNAASNSQYQRDISDYMSWGITDMFVHRGVRFMTYPAVFMLPGGAGTEKAIADGEAHVIPRVRDLFRGYYGPNNKLSGANNAGAEMFAFEFTDPKDEFHELQVETAPLFFCTKPNTLIKLFENVQ